MSGDDVTQPFGGNPSLRPATPDRGGATSTGERYYRTAEEWCELLDVLIVDPDGWRGPGAPAWTEPISRDAFDAAYALSTVDHRGRRAALAAGAAARIGGAVIPQTDAEPELGRFELHRRAWRDVVDLEEAVAGTKVWKCVVSARQPGHVHTERPCSEDPMAVPTAYVAPGSGMVDYFQRAGQLRLWPAEPECRCTAQGGTEVYSAECPVHGPDAPRRPTIAEERLELARRALVATGYFTEEEVGEDVAPRITELASALGRSIEMEAAGADAGGPRLPQGFLAGTGWEPQVVDRPLTKSELDKLPFIDTAGVDRIYIDPARQRRGWETAVLGRFLAEMPAEGEAVDFLAVLSSAMIASREQS